MTHPACCPDPDNCALTYREHLLGVGIASAAIPTRAVHRTPGLPDEPAVRTEAREKRWAKDIPAYRALKAQGYNPQRIDGCDKLTALAKTDFDVNHAVAS